MDPSWYYRRRRIALLWAVVATLLLGAAWERFAERYRPEDRGLALVDGVFVRASHDLGRTLRALPPPAAPRVAIFGSSQIATVKDGGPSFPLRLDRTLAREGVPHEIVDLSAGGQQTLESMVILFAAERVVRPDVVWVGVSLFSMLGLDVRDTLLAAIDGEAVQHEILAHVPADARPDEVRQLVAFARKPSQRVASRGETIQQRIDRGLGAWFAAHLDAVGNRQALFDEIVDRPLRRDLQAWVQRRFQATRTARTYRPNDAYPVSLLALETMQSLCRSLGVEMVVALLPFDHHRPPIPFSDETMARVRADLDAAARRAGFALVDHSDLLDSRYFGDYVDGSPDNLHFRAPGHERLAGAVAPRLTALLAGRPPGR